MIRNRTSQTIFWSGKNSSRFLTWLDYLHQEKGLKYAKITQLCRDFKICLSPLHKLSLQNPKQKRRGKRAPEFGYQLIWASGGRVALLLGNIPGEDNEHLKWDLMKWLYGKSVMYHLSLPFLQALQMLQTACLIQRAISLISRSKSQEA